jgi:hypothetical protein
LDVRRQKLMEKIPGWEWEPLEDSWNRQYQLSLKHGVVELRFVLPDGTRLGQWQANMRKNGGNNNYMTPERKKLMEKIPGWAWDFHDNEWNIRYQLTKKHGEVKTDFVVDGIKLGMWQATMRRQNGNNRYITPERKKLLEKIPGWSWSKNDSAWNEKYLLTIKYKHELSYQTYYKYLQYL